MTAPREANTPGPMSHAALSVGEVETLYRRAGSGAPVVLLGLRSDVETSIVERLAQAGNRWRVLVPDRTTLTALAPDPTPGESHFSIWLSGFLQGLGLDRPSVVAAGTFVEELERYETAHPDELRQVLIVDDPATSAAEIMEQLARH